MPLRSARAPRARVGEAYEDRPAGGDVDTLAIMAPPTDAALLPPGRDVLGPALTVVAALMWLDRYEAEPPALLAAAFAWGAVIAPGVSLLVNQASLAALMVEETAKGLGVLAILLLRRRGLDGVVDGIVYGGMAGIGFALIENVLYLGQAFGDAGGDGAMTTFVARGLFSPFAHPFFTMAIGVGLWVAASHRGFGPHLLAPLLGWVVAVVLHGAWNLSALSGLQGFVLAYVLFQVPVFAAAVALAVAARRREGRSIVRHLGAYVAAGWLTAAEAAMIGQMPERTRAREWAGRTRGPRAARAMRGFQDLGSELAFLRERMTRGTAPADAASLEQRMLLTMWQLRLLFLPDRAGPGRGTEPQGRTGTPARASGSA